MSRQRQQQEARRRGLTSAPRSYLLPILPPALQKSLDCGGRERPPLSYYSRESFGPRTTAPDAFRPYWLGTHDTDLTHAQSSLQAALPYPSLAGLSDSESSEDGLKGSRKRKPSAGIHQRRTRRSTGEPEPKRRRSSTEEQRNANRKSQQRCRANNRLRARAWEDKVGFESGVCLPACACVCPAVCALVAVLLCVSLPADLCTSACLLRMPCIRLV